MRAKEESSKKEEEDKMERRRGGRREGELKKEEREKRGREFQCIVYGERNFNKRMQQISTKFWSGESDQRREWPDDVKNLETMKFEIHRYKHYVPSL